MQHKSSKASACAYQSAIMQRDPCNFSRKNQNHHKGLTKKAFPCRWKDRGAQGRTEGSDCSAPGQLGRTAWRGSAEEVGVTTATQASVQRVPSLLQRLKSEAYNNPPPSHSRLLGTNHATMRVPKPHQYAVIGRKHKHCNDNEHWVNRLQQAQQEGGIKHLHTNCRAGVTNTCSQRRHWLGLIYKCKGGPYKPGPSEFPHFAMLLPANNRYGDPTIFCI